MVLFEKQSPAKFIFVALGAMLATFICFYIMLLLISNELTREIDLDQTAYVVPSFHEREPDKPEPAREKPEKLLPLQPPDNPEGKPVNQIPDTEIRSERPVFGSIAELIGPQDIDLQLAAPHAEFSPLHLVRPFYPLSAARREIEGYVIVEFTVRENGTVVDPIVVESEPEIMFDQAALSAISRSKFKPREIGGDLVRVDGVQMKFAFNLESLYDVEENRE